MEDILRSKPRSLKELSDEASLISEYRGWHVPIENSNSDEKCASLISEYRGWHVPIENSNDRISRLLIFPSNTKKPGSTKK